jgi:hypothetical protein
MTCLIHFCWHSITSNEFSYFFCHLYPLISILFLYSHLFYHSFCGVTKLKSWTNFLCRFWVLCEAITNVACDFYEPLVSLHSFFFPSLFISRTQTFMLYVLFSWTISSRFLHINATKLCSGISLLFDVNYFCGTFTVYDLI